MKILRILFALILVTSAFAHPGGGIVALSENSALVTDPTENFIWIVESGKEPKRLVSKIHPHWMTRGRDGNLYTEAFGERGGAWPTAAFRLNVETGTVTPVADHAEVPASVFAVDRDGSLVFQKGASLVSRKNGKEAPFRASAEKLNLKEVTAYVWSGEDLIFADRNQIHRIDSNGGATLVAEIEGKVLEPRIWNGIDVPVVFGLALEKNGAVLATVPHLAKIYRIGKNQKPHELICPEGNWRATGVSVFDDSIFLMESDSRASTSPRVRILRPGGQIEVLTLPPRTK